MDINTQAMESVVVHHPLPGSTAQTWAPPLEQDWSYKFLRISRRDGVPVIWLLKEHTPGQNYSIGIRSTSDDFPVVEPGWIYLGSVDLPETTMHYWQFTPPLSVVEYTPPVQPSKTKRR